MPYKRRPYSSSEQIEREIRAHHKKRYFRELVIIGTIALVGMLSIVIVIGKAQSIHPQMHENRKLREEQRKEQKEIHDLELKKKDPEVGKKDPEVHQ